MPETIVSQCIKFNNCPFFAKFSDYDEFNFTGFKNMYCHGPLMRTCARATYRQRFGENPPDDLAPSGIIFRPKR